MPNASSTRRPFTRRLWVNLDLRVPDEARAWEIYQTMVESVPERARSDMLRAIVVAGLQTLAERGEATPPEQTKRRGRPARATRSLSRPSPDLPSVPAATTMPAQAAVPERLSPNRLPPDRSPPQRSRVDRQHPDTMPAPAAARLDDDERRRPAPADDGHAARDRIDSSPRDEREPEQPRLRQPSHGADDGLGNMMW